MRRGARTRFDPEDTNLWIERELTAGRLTGGAIGIHHAGASVLSETFGVRDLHDNPVTSDTLFWIASMTKPVVSAAAMALIERDMLSLDDTVSTFIPGFGEYVLKSDGKTVEPAQRPVTILDLMTHTSGLIYSTFGREAIHRLYADQGMLDYQSDNATMVAKLARLPLLHHPGTVFEYGMSTDVLGRVIEIVADTGLDKALSELVLEPLEMNNTTFSPDIQQLADMPSSPTWKGIVPPFDTTSVWWSGGAGLCSTVSDYLGFVRMLTDGLRPDGSMFLQPETIQLMRTDHLGRHVRYGRYTGSLGITAPWSENGLGFGLGLAVRTRCVKHIQGTIGEFLWPGISGANFWVDPEKELMVVFLTHAPEHRSQHRIDLRRAVYAGL